MKKRCLLSPILLCCLLISACEPSCLKERIYSEAQDIVTSNSESSTATVIVFGNRFKNLSGLDGNDLKQYFEQNGQGKYEKMEITSDDSLVLTLSDSEIQYWQNFVNTQIEKAKESFPSDKEKYSSIISEDYMVISMWYDMSFDPAAAFAFVKDTSIYCAMGQVFSGIQNYSINLYIYNADTGKLVAGGNLETEDVSYDNTEWRISYTLSPEEEKKISQNDNVTDYPCHSTFIDGISVLDIFHHGGGTSYTYLYLDQSDTVHIGITAKQTKHLKAELKAYLQTITRQFSSLGNGYSIDVDDDYTNIVYRFDGNLSRQAQADYVTYSETICMLLQVLETGSEDYYISLEIYDSSTGQLISTGDSKDGITWQIT